MLSHKNAPGSDVPQKSAPPAVIVVVPLPSPVNEGGGVVPAALPKAARVLNAANAPGRGEPAQCADDQEFICSFHG